MGIAKQFVLVGAAEDATTSRLQARGIRYVHKNLNSGPANWRAIVDAVAESDGVIFKFNRHNFEQLSGNTGNATTDSLYAPHAQVAPDLLRAIAGVPHLVLVHQDILGGSDWVTETPAAWVHSGEEYEETLSDAARQSVLGMLDSAGVQVTAYRRNAEATELASAFLDDTETHLLLRIYLPSTAPHSDEGSRLLDVFREWLVNVRHMGVRLSTHRTQHGEVIEFFASDSTSHADFQKELAKFQDYVDLVSSPEAATAMLQGLGVGENDASEFVLRHGMLLKRIRIDITHERERRELSLRQSAESELIELARADASTDSIRALVVEILPGPSTAGPRDGGATSVYINNQTFHAVYGNVQQTLGDVPAPTIVAQALSDLPDGGISPRQMGTIAELSDDDLPLTRRQQAAARLKTFLLRSKDRLETEAFRIAFAWVEQQL
ncbi:hypothetical protein [Microbacterium murale]|uniref:Uncharacterized protein n=1 Tax=Microbacterium murale TaxID=1081040 RepID=A0ABQ1RZB5_9MICO|nr:hypothetical protein [Microbacterium murale]GGD88117.1 hypothetical protein GCM10007269_33610 [Microbacterium murale]